MNKFELARQEINRQLILFKIETTLEKMHELTATVNAYLKIGAILPDEFAMYNKDIIKIWGEGK